MSKAALGGSKEARLITQGLSLLSTVCTFSQVTKASLHSIGFCNVIRLWRITLQTPMGRRWSFDGTDRRADTHIYHFPRRKWSRSHCEFTRETQCLRRAQQEVRRGLPGHLLSTAGACIDDGRRLRTHRRRAHRPRCSEASCAHRSWSARF